MTSIPDFRDFYMAVHGRPPLPWQARLADTVHAEGWPAEIGVPTGLGKTSCIDVAVWALAAAATGSQRPQPTRIWYVVNRRLLVDAAADHGMRLARLLAAADSDEVIRSVAERLVAVAGPMGSPHLPLAVTRLRGGAELGARPPHPACPALILATVPMFASSWLFRGYASSPSMRPVDAAHAGIDALVLLDEAHLAQPLRRLAEPVAECDVGNPSLVVPAVRSRPVFVSMTATGDAVEPFVLDDADMANPLVVERLVTPKPVRLERVRQRSASAAEALARVTLAELGTASVSRAVVVFANDPATARAVFDGLVEDRAVLSDSDRLVLLTGRMRLRESENARRTVLDSEVGVPSGWDRSRSRPGHLIVVATQALEVGADLDFDILVTEACGTRALVQRLGRLNRLGVATAPRGVVVHLDHAGTWGIYHKEPLEVWRRLVEDDSDGDGVVDLAPARIAAVLGPPNDQPVRVPALLPFHLWEWAKTTTPPPGEAPVELFFEGLDSTGPRVAVCWRCSEWAPGDRLVPSVEVGESIDLPLSELRRAVGEAVGPDEMVLRLGHDRVTLEQSAANQLRPGDVLVLSSALGLYDDHGWSPDERHREVIDVSLARWPGLPLDAASLRHWFLPGPACDQVIALAGQLADDDADERLTAQELRVAVSSLEARSEVADGWAELCERLQARVEWQGSLPMLQAAARSRSARGAVVLASDAFDDLSADTTAVALQEHLASVGEIAEHLAVGLGLPEPVVAAVAAAGRFHDLGKADSRFQRWLDPRGEAPGPVAKSAIVRSQWRAARQGSGWPAGGRHESLSGRIVESWLAEVGPQGWDPDLVSHLVVSHHGYGRPLVPPAEDASGHRCVGRIEGVDIDVDADLSEVDWEQPARFRRCCERYGYWGLALLEAIVRQADHLASSRVGADPLEVA